MGLGGYFLAQSRNWQEIIHAPNPGAILTVVVGLITFLVAFFGCCVCCLTEYGVSERFQGIPFTYVIVVGIVFIIEVAAVILLLGYMKGVKIYPTSHLWKSFCNSFGFRKRLSCNLRSIF